MFTYDYVSLYNHAKRVTVNGTSTIIFTKAKYFLPMLITKVYLNAMLSSFVQSKPFYFFIISAILEIVFIFFMLIVRPFVSTFTNFRIILISLIMIAADVSIQIYIYNSLNNEYFTFYERLTVYLILGALASATLFIIIQHLKAWSKQMWRLLQPCLKGARLMGHRKNRFDFDSVS